MADEGSLSPECPPQAVYGKANFLCYYVVTTPTAQSDAIEACIDLGDEDDSGMAQIDTKQEFEDVSKLMDVMTKNYSTGYTAPPPVPAYVPPTAAYPPGAYPQGYPSATYPGTYPSTHPQSNYPSTSYPPAGYPQGTYSQPPPSTQSPYPPSTQAAYPSTYQAPDPYHTGQPQQPAYNPAYPSATSIYPNTSAAYPSSSASYPTAPPIYPQQLPYLTSPQAANMYSYSYSYSNSGGNSYSSYSSTGGYKPYSHYNTRSYVKGWSPSSGPSSYVPQCPTITDTGAGSANIVPSPAPVPAVPGGPASKPAAPVEKRKIDVKLAPSKRYEEIVKESLASGKPWVDKDFPATNKSLFYENPPSGYHNIVWKRPHELCGHPKFATGASRLDVQQGSLGDCWLLAAIADLTTNPILFSRVVPSEQSFDKPNYSGVYRFYFWQYGHWVEVLVDDLLPTRNGELVYMKSERGDEFWSSLLEKAYAKLCGSYEALSGGLMSESFEDFTGGIAYRVELRSHAPPDLFSRMLKAHEKGALLGCSIDSAANTRENQLRNGLIIGHAYSITNVTYLEAQNRKVALLRIRNPWGDEHEWNGAWSDSSSEWSHVSEAEKNRIGHKNGSTKDGEFWMCYEDFAREFERLEFCLLGPDSAVGSACPKDQQMATGHLYSKAWEGTLLEGSWKRRVNAGGCKNYPETFWTNPQYKIHVTADKVDGGGALGHMKGSGGEGPKGTIIVALMQKNRRKLRSEGKEDLSIGFYVYKLTGKEGQGSTLNRQFFDRTPPIAKSSAFTDLREVAEMFRLDPGDYVIMPTSFEPNLEAEFVLRVFHESEEHQLREMDEEPIDFKAEKVPDAVVEVKDSDADVKLREEFFAEFERVTSQVKGGAKKDIDAYQLRQILNKLLAREWLKSREFEVELCRSLLSLHDPDISGRLDFNEYKNLWQDLSGIQKVFKASDAAGQGYINSYELRNVLHSVAEKNPGLKGLRISNSTFRAVAIRFSDSEGRVQFDDFLACVSRLKATIMSFKAQQEKFTEPASFYLDEFVQLSIYS